jgi:hypothetical protein
VLRLVADENFNGRILRALQRRIPDLDVVRVQDTPLLGTADPDLLTWAAAEGRVVLTHDVTTLVGHAVRRVRSGEIMPGVIIVGRRAAVGAIAADLEVLILAGGPEELDRQIAYVPFR